MSNRLIDRPGPVLFIGGVTCLVVAAALGFFLAHEAATKLSHLGPQDYLRLDAKAETEQINAASYFLSNVNALMWMVFGLGACLTLVGLRRLTSPRRDFRPSRVFGSIGKDLENPE